MKIGDLLPPPYYEWALGPVGYQRRRRCLNCGLVWKTVEIPVSEHFSGARADCCWSKRHEGKLVVGKYEGRSLRMKDLVKQEWWTPGRLRAAQVGGTHHRRICTDPDCRDKRGKRTRWSTMEVAASGTVTADISKCPRCITGEGQIIGTRRKEASRARPKKSPTRRKTRWAEQLEAVRQGLCPDFGKIHNTANCGCRIWNKLGRKNALEKT